jgi:hypothetical protein
MLRNEHANLRLFPGILLRCINENAWSKRVIETGECVSFDRFEDFLTAPPPQGLGADMRTVRHLCEHNPEARNALESALVTPMLQRGLHNER